MWAWLCSPVNAWKAKWWYLGSRTASGVANRVLDAGVAHGLELVFRRHGEGVADDVVRLSLLHGRVRAPHGLARVVRDGILLVLHLYLAERAVRRYLVLGDDGRDVVAVDAHAVVEQLAVGHVALCGGGGGVPRVPRDGKGGLGHVEAGEHAHDARHRLRLRHVHRDDAAVADGRVEDLGHEARLGAEVVREHGATGDLVTGVDALDLPADLPVLLQFLLLSYKNSYGLKNINCLLQEKHEWRARRYVRKRGRKTRSACLIKRRRPLRIVTPIDLEQELYSNGYTFS